MTASRCPCGVIAYQGRIICYELVPEWSEQVQEGPAGGTLRIPIMTGRRLLQARELGHEAVLDITPELLTSLEEDMEKSVWMKFWYDKTRRPQST